MPRDGFYLEQPSDDLARAETDRTGTDDRWAWITITGLCLTAIVLLLAVCWLYKNGA